MQTCLTHKTTTGRLVHLLDELSAGCDREFDDATEDLDREFAEIHLQLND